MKAVAALFVMADTHYRALGCECYDVERDARSFSGNAAVVCHPPCRAWGRLAHVAKPRDDEMDLARFAVAKVRQCGGVLEHPSASRLWIDQQLPSPGSTDRDTFGGWTYPVSQKWWGHKCEKRTWLYVCGIEPAQLPAFPLVLGEAEWKIGGREGSKSDRMRTPPAFAEWLVDVARACG